VGRRCATVGLRWAPTTQTREAYLSGGDVDERYATDLFRERAVETIARHGALHGGANGSASDLLQ
jgi:hypothetical protein